MIIVDCADVGKVKGPILHALAAPAPYFHNGSAASLHEVVNFYDQRFTINLSDKEKDGSSESPKDTLNVSRPQRSRRAERLSVRLSLS
jgi:cytochrome c peroxidase